ncbi:hypothetical protein ACI2KS_25675 [Pseudomonas sp. NPDC087358]|uniref:hypothetical protein n=1 Tax=Pseudomonas sp. NPDC087358 TaxID=3364439 RepID=UPI0038504EDB
MILAEGRGSVACLAIWREAAAKPFGFAMPGTMDLQRFCRFRQIAAKPGSTPSAETVCMHVEAVIIGILPGFFFYSESE